MTENNLIEYFKTEDISINYDRERDGYWLSLQTEDYFVDLRAFRDFQRDKGISLFNKLVTYNSDIPFSLGRNGVSIKSLEYALSEVKRKEDSELEEFRKANNL